MSIGPPIPETQHLQNLTLKIQGHGHGWHGHWKSQHWSNSLSTHISIIPCQSDIPFLRYDFLKFDLENQRSRSWVRGTLKVTKWVQHQIDSHPFRFMPIGLSIPEIQHFQNLTLKMKGQIQMTMTLHNYRSRQFHRTSNGINPSSGFRYMGSTKWPKCCLIWQVSGQWASPYGANGQITLTLHNYMSRQVQTTLNGVNPSSSFRDMRSAKSGPNLWQIWQVFGPLASRYGANLQRTGQCSTIGLDNSTELRMEKIRQAFTEIWVPQVWQPPTRPVAGTVTTIPLQPEGLRGKKPETSDTFEGKGVAMTGNNQVSDRNRDYILVYKVCLS